jgi:hypothetical protein
LTGFEPATIGASGNHTNHYTTKATMRYPLSSCTFSAAARVVAPGVRGSSVRSGVHSDGLHDYRQWGRPGVEQHARPPDSATGNSIGRRNSGRRDSSKRCSGDRLHIARISRNVEHKQSCYTYDSSIANLNGRMNANLKTSKERMQRHLYHHEVFHKKAEIVTWGSNCK